MNQSPENVLPTTEIITDDRQCEYFLHALDPIASAFTFLVIPENGKLNGARAEERSGSFHELQNWIRHHNNQGYGVFVTVNQTNLQGRKKDDIEAIRVIFQEDDGGWVGEFPLEPNLVVQTSAGRFHRYWFVEAGSVIALEEFEAVQQRLVDDYGSDPNAKDRSRVMRLPGTFHNKGEPQLVRITEVGWMGRYSWDQIKQAFPPVVRQGKVAATAAAVEQGAVVVDPGALADAWNALQWLDADDREQWLMAGMALHRGSAGGEAGWRMWDAWSRGSGKYVEGETWQKWNGFDGEREDGVGLGSLFHHAAEAGWERPQEPTWKPEAGEWVEGVKDWLCGDLGLPEGHLAGIMTDHLAGLRKGLWRDQLTDAVARATGVGKRAINAEIKHVVEREAVQEAPRDYSGEAEFNRYHGVVNHNGRATVVSRVYDATSNRWDTRFSSYHDSKLYYANLLTAGGEGGPIPVFESWVSWRSRRTYSGVEFNPIKGLVATNAELPTGGRYNLYQGLALTPMPGNCQLILNHLYHVWCSENGELFEYVLGWLARMFQKPDRPGHSALVLRSEQGTGKNIIVDILTSAFGSHAVTCNRSEDVAGRFNDHLGTSVLVFLNEALWGGEKSAEGALKTMITDKALTVERKHMPRFEVRNCTHLIIASNSDYPVPMGISDRRFCVIDVNEDRRGDREYFAALRHEIRNGGREAFIHFLLNYSIEGFDPAEIPYVASATRLEGKLRSANSVVQWWSDVLHTGEITTGGFSRPDGWADEEWMIPISALFSSYEQWCQDHRQHIVPRNVMGRNLRKLCPVIRNYRPFKQGRCYVLPWLEKARKEFEKFIGEKMEWGE